MLNKSVLALVAGIGLSATSLPTHAIPLLQLDIAGVTYDSSTETTITSADAFSLYAYITPSHSCDAACTASLLGTQYFVSVALAPQTSTSGNYGSFSYNTGSGSTLVNATSNMTYGRPPLEGALGTSDPGDLAPHGIYDTYFYEIPFYFALSNTASTVNVQDNAGLGPDTTGTGMYYAEFDFDKSALLDGFDLHFDLYNELMRSGDIDINNFAPFSHDAATTTTKVPEPTAIALFGIGLIGMGFASSLRRRSK
ncbi:MAG: choice-of-anchor N protein [Gammaproteobacteria bacterium]|nr:choice-of-anchor N protein [Gammaproteobacteria bacterium]